MLKILKKEPVAIIFLFVLALFLFTWKIGSIPIIDGDSAFYAEIAKNIVKSGDWITLHYAHAQDLIDKPPLVLWLMALGFKLFGIHEFGLSLWHSLIAAFTVLVTYFTARELFNRKTALISALILLTAAQFFYQGRVPLQDMPLTFFISAALLCFVLFNKYRNYWAGYLVPVFLALAVLVKGPIGLALPALIILVYLIAAKKLFSYSKTDYWVHFPLTIVVFLLVAAPWFIAEYQILGQRLIEIFWARNFGRFLFPVDTVGAQAHLAAAKPQYDFYSYFLQLLLVLIPWSGFFYPALYYQFKTLREEGTAKIFTLSWALVPMIFFSASLNYKIARYLLPSLPALAILIGKFWCDYLERPKELEKPFLISNLLNLFLVLPGLVLLTLVLILQFPGQQIAYRPIALPFLGTLVSGMLISSVILLFKKPKVAFLGLFLSALVAYTVLIGCFDLYFKEANPTRYFALRLKSLANPNHPVGQYIGSGTAFLTFYADRQVLLLNSDADLKSRLKAKTKFYAVTEYPQDLEKFSRDNPGLVKIIEKKTSMVLFSN